MVAVLEYVVAELLELAGNVAKDNKKMRIIPRHIQLAVRNNHGHRLGGVLFCYNLFYFDVQGYSTSRWDTNIARLTQLIGV